MACFPIENAEKDTIIEVETSGEHSETYVTECSADAHREAWNDDYDDHD